MTSIPRWVTRHSAAELRLGDYVRVTRRTGSGTESWSGTVVDVDVRLRVATITDGHHVTRPALRGACYVDLLVPAAERLDLPVAPNLAHRTPEPGGLPALTHY